MTTLYKLTTSTGLTRAGERNETKWGPGITHEAQGSGTELCSDGFIHAYTSPLLAVLLNPIHANIDFPLLWECEGVVLLSDHGLKVGCKKLTTIRTLPVPIVTQEQRIAFGILCALEVERNVVFVKWARKWLSGEDRTKTAASTMMEAAAAGAAAMAAAAAAAIATARAAATAAAIAAATAATAATAASLDLQSLAEKALEY